MPKEKTVRIVMTRRIGRRLDSVHLAIPVVTQRRNSIKEEMAKTPCIYFARGDCRRGNKCLYLHEKKGAAAPKSQGPSSAELTEAQEGTKAEKAGRSLCPTELGLQCYASQARFGP